MILLFDLFILPAAAYSLRQGYSAFFLSVPGGTLVAEADFELALSNKIVWGLVCPAEKCH